ncbi:MAG: trypsin-like peptidase domain-containing protein [Verrucomicrobia bacterium]|nr:trypsin-like peptidase domain-containing protein [Verrucomicrobiota bacterium]MDA1048076.1 trypsin-like peptidase domain-containing protein [Verrucomicrobiota bacterium]
MYPRFISYFIILASPWLSLIALDETKLSLKSGASVSGQLLKENPDHLVLDLGFSVLTVPRSEIASVDKQPGEVGGASNAFAASLFRETTNARERPLRELVARLGESVVMVRTPVGLGSGFLIHPEGYLITNDHVIAGERKISVTIFRHTETELIKDNYDNVRIVAAGGNVDLALLKIEGATGKTFATVPLGRSEELRQGDRVFAIGNPLGLERSVSEGIVSLRNRIIQSRLHVQTTAEINPGNSGGPLFNYRGEVVGVNNLKIVSTGAEGLGFAIPVRTLKTFLQNRDAFAFDPRNPNAGFRYNPAPR